MWQTKRFRSTEAYKKWVERNEGRCQIECVFCNTTPAEAAKGIRNHAVQYRRLMRVY